MHIEHTYVDLSTVGYLHTYELSDSEGELVHEFPPLGDDLEAVAVVAVEGEGAEALAFEVDGERRPASAYTVRENSQGESPISAVSLPLDGRSVRARFRFFGRRAVTVYVAVFRRVGDATAAAIGRAMERFRDKCWACMRLVKFFIAIPTSGGIDEEAALEAIYALLPDDIAAWLVESEFGQMLGDILLRIRALDPRHRIARSICEDLGFCLAA